MAEPFFAATTFVGTFPFDFVLAFGATTALVDEVFVTDAFTVAWVMVKFPLLVLLFVEDVFGLTADGNGGRERDAAGEADFIGVFG